MRRFLAYVVMMLTVVSTLVFNTQSVFESTTDAMEYGKSTQLTFSLTNRDEADYPIGSYPNMNPDVKKNDLTKIDIENRIMSRLDDLGVRNANVELVKGIESGEEAGEAYRVNVSFSPLSTAELDNVKKVLSYDGSLSIATVGDDTVYYQDRKEFFDTDKVAELVYSGTTPYPAIRIQSTSVMDDLITKAKTAAESHKEDKKTEDSTTKSRNRKYANDAQGGEGKEDAAASQETKLYLWNNKTKDDTYNKAYGYNGETVDSEVLNKVVCVLDTSNYSADNKIITMTSDKDGNAFTVSSARAMVSMLNAEDYGFDIHYLYSNPVYAGFGANALRNTYIGFAVALLAIAVLMIVFYGLSGITASINLFASVFVSTLLFNLLGFEFSVAGVIGLAVVSVFSVFLSVNYFQHVKNELKKGRDIEKANREGYRKSFFGGLDTGIVLFVASLFSFLLSLGSFKTFFGAVMVGTLFSWIITTFMNKWGTYWLCKDVKENNRPFFGFFKNNKEKEVKAVKPGKKGRAPLYATLAVSLGLLAVALPLNFALGQGELPFFNNSGTYADSYQLSIEFATYSASYNRLESSQTYIKYLQSIGKDSDEKFVLESRDSYKDSVKDGVVTYNPTTAFVNVVEKKDDDGLTYFVTYFTLHTDQDLNVVKSSSNSNKTVKEAISDAMNDTSTNVEIDGTNINPLADGNYMAKSFHIYSQKTTALNLVHDIKNLFLIVFLIAAFASIYAFIRFGLNMFLTVLTSGTVFAALSIGLLSITKLAFNPYIAFVVLAVNLVYDFLMIPLFNENKPILKELGLKGVADEEKRASVLNDLISKNGIVILLSLVSMLVLMVPVFFIDISLLSSTILGVLLSVLAFVSLIGFALPFYLLCTSHISFRRLTDWFTMKRESRNEKKEKAKEERKEEASKAVNPNEFAPDGTRYVDPEGPHETIIIGMNEFLH